MERKVERQKARLRAQMDLVLRRETGIEGDGSAKVQVFLNAAQSDPSPDPYDGARVGTRRGP